MSRIIGDPSPSSIKKNESIPYWHANGAKRGNKPQNSRWHLFISNGLPKLPHDPSAGIAKR